MALLKSNDFSTRESVFEIARSLPNQQRPRFNIGIVIMVLEVAILEIKPELLVEFETAFKTASVIIASVPGYVFHELQHCLETPSRYILLVRWQKLEDHTIGFRQSAEYQQWRSLLHHFYDPFPTVEHYELVQSDSGS